MKVRMWLVLFALVVAVPTWELRAQSPIGTAFTYQGQLTKGGQLLTDTADLQFTLWDAATTPPGLQIGAAVYSYSVSVTDGLFTTTIDFGSDAFKGDARWLEIAVRSPAGSGSYTTLAPRQELTPTPFALYALDCPGAGSAWNLTGNAGTDPSANFLGTSDNAPLIFRVNNQRALRIEDTPGHVSINMIGGHQSNCVTTSASGTTIAGGGYSGCPNTVTDDYGTVGGGYRNQAGDAAGSAGDSPGATVGGGGYNRAAGAAATVGGGDVNTASGVQSTVAGGFTNSAGGGGSTVGGGRENNSSADHSTVGGGSSNTASGEFSTIAGGFTNLAGGANSTVGGGRENNASADHSTVGGGGTNTASGFGSAVPGGMFNQAGGVYSLAAGQRAHVRSASEVGSGDTNGDEGTFVWADMSNTGSSFTSTGPNQFLVRAAGGVGINTNSPTSPLTVAGLVESQGGGFKFPDGSTQITAATPFGLPYSGTVESPDNAFSVVNTGAGGAARFEIMGGGDAYSAIIGVGHGAGPVIYGYTDGTGRAARFDLANAESTSDALTANNSGFGVGIRAANLNPASTNPALYASTAGTGPAGQFAGPVQASGLIESTAGGFKFPDGTVQTTAATGGDGAWSLTGNAGTDPNVNFLGTTDNVPLELKVNNQRALRIERAGSDPWERRSINVVAGCYVNGVTPGVTAATIAGGGCEDGPGTPGSPNVVTDDYGTVAGGMGNQAGDNDPNSDNALYATVAGGQGNVAGGSYAFVGGGRNNTAEYSGAVGGGWYNEATGDHAVVGGGYSNVASGDYATVAAGLENHAVGLCSVVLGGSANMAGSAYSLAAGCKAKVRDPSEVDGADTVGDEGTFVWADRSNLSGFFTSTGPNQFLIRAAGGVGINTNSPAVGLDVVGSNTIGGNHNVSARFRASTDPGADAGVMLGCLNGNTPFVSDVPTGGTSTGITIRTGNSERLRITKDGDVGIGTNAPTHQLEVAAASSEAALGVYNHRTGSSGPGLLVSTTGPGSWAITACDNATTGGGVGVLAISESTSGTGVHGIAGAPSGTTQGGRFEADSSSGRGVIGEAHSVSGETYGGVFTAASTSGCGLVGQATATSGETYAGKFYVASPNGYGVYAFNTFQGTSDAPAVLGRHDLTDGSGTGVTGQGGQMGVHGIVSATGSHSYYGVHGEVSGGSGRNVGVTGTAFCSGSGSTAYGVYGVAGATDSSYGVYGEALGGANQYAGFFAGRGYFSGNVGVGGWLASDPSESLDAVGTARLRGIAAGSGTTVVADANGKLWKSSSSRRCKTDIRPLAPAPGDALSLQPVAFRWSTTGQDDVGLVAEDVADVLPELVICDSDGQPDAVQYDKLALYLLDVIKSQREQIAGQQTEIANQQAEIEAQQESVSDLQKRLARVEALVGKFASQAEGEAP